MYRIPCKHEAEGMSTSIRLSDYHPLHFEEIEKLLTDAKETQDVQVKNDIQIRLCQGIIGYECPRRDSGRTAEAEHTVDRLFMEFIKNPDGVDIAMLAHQMDDLMQLK